jgi:lysozyme family protein
MADFNIAVQKTLVNEGGFQNDPNDSGNWYKGINYGTNFGITVATLLAYVPDCLADANCIRNLTQSQAIKIYQEGYWKALYSQITNQALAEKLFDMGVLMGVETAVRLLQISMDNSVQIVTDGDFGTETLGDVNQYGDLVQYRTVLFNHCMDIINQHPEKSEFVKDWIRRISS